MSAGIHSYRSTYKPANSFRGARVNLDDRYVVLEDAAECNPSPASIPTNIAWQGCYGGTGWVTIILDNNVEHKLLLP